MEPIPGYDAWKLRGPPDPPECRSCGGQLDEDNDCKDCSEHLMTAEEERDAKGDHDYEAQRDYDS